MKRIIALLLSVVLIFSLTACSDKTETEVKKDKVSVVLDWYPNAIHGFIYNAIEKGYYEEENIEVEILFPANVNDGITMPAAGQADLGIYYLQDIILSRANENVPIKSVGALTVSQLNVIASLKEKGVESPKDLEGKLVGYSGTDLAKARIEYMMEKQGVNPKDIELIDVGFDIMSSLTTGKVDACAGAFVNHEIPFLEKEGFEMNYFYEKDYGVPDNYEMLFVTGDNNLKENSDKLKRFMKASKKGFDYMKKHPEETIDIILKHQNKENFPLEKDVEMMSIDVLLPLMEANDGEFMMQDEKIWQENIDWLKEIGVLKNDITAEELFTNDLVK